MKNYPGSNEEISEDENYQISSEGIWIRKRVLKKDEDRED